MYFSDNLIVRVLNGQSSKPVQWGVRDTVPCFQSQFSKKCLFCCSASFHFFPYWYKAIFLSVPDCTAHQSLFVALMISRLLVYNKQIEVSSFPWCRVCWTVIDFTGIKNVKMALGQKIQNFLKWHSRHVSAKQMRKGN